MTLKTEITRVWIPLHILIGQKYHLRSRTFPTSTELVPVVERSIFNYLFLEARCKLCMAPIGQIRAFIGFWFFISNSLYLSFVRDTFMARLRNSQIRRIYPIAPLILLNYSSFLILLLLMLISTFAPPQCIRREEWSFPTVFWKQQLLYFTSSRWFVSVEQWTSEEQWEDSYRIMGLSKDDDICRLYIALARDISLLFNISYVVAMGNYRSDARLLIYRYKTPTDKKSERFNTFAIRDALYTSVVQFSQRNKQ